MAFGAHKDAVYGFAWRMAPAAADDIVQETVLRVRQQAPTITGSLRSYLFRTARNIMIDNYRKSQRRPQEAEERDRRLAERRIFPAIDVLRSGTRREELLLDENTLRMVWTMRRMLSAVGPNEGIELLMQRLGKTKDNAEFLVSLSKSVEASER